MVLLEIPCLSSGFGSREAFITIYGSEILSNKPGQDGQRRKEKRELCLPRSVCTCQCTQCTGVFRDGGEETPKNAKDALLNPGFE